MKVSRPSGEEVVVSIRRRMRGRDLLIERDVSMYCDRLRGVRSSEIAFKFKISKQLVNRRIKRMPEKVKQYLRGRVSRLMDGGIFCGISDEDRSVIDKLTRAEASQKHAVG
ncbi:hypothetical protein [Singulisphaera sp. PoT]|uniref:hypothetical protein n=1 Tax=Singulisphaera sp. PoT TaxID=3411797 RepID=UPI003BF4E524